MDKLIELDGIGKTFSTGGLWKSAQRVTALEDISLEVKKGEILAVLGESGSGKSTLAKVLTRLETPDAGRFRLAGELVRGACKSRAERLAFGSRVQMIFQDPFASLNGVHTVGYHLRRAFALHRPELGRAIVEQRAGALLESVGLRPGSSYLDKFPFELSGGQRQRVAIARALALEPEILIADEPTSMLDVSIRMDILNLIQGLRESRGLAIILITHDLPSAWYLSDRVAVIYAGQIVEIGATAEVLARPAHPYTQLLLQVAKQKILRHAPARVVKPSLERRQACLFVDRCPRAAASCHLSRPPLDPVEADRAARCFYPFDRRERETYNA